MDSGIRISVLADDGDLGMPPGRRFGQLDVHVSEVADIREHPDLGLASLAFDDRLELAVDRELHVALRVGKRQIWRNTRIGAARKRREAQQIARDELKESAVIANRERACIPDGKVFLRWLGLVEIYRGKHRAIGALRQFIALRRRYRAYELRPVRVVELRKAIRAIEHEIVLQQHVSDGNAVLRDERQVAVRAADREQADKA